MIAAKETTLTEIGVMLTHVVEHMATKEDVARLDTRIDDLRTEMIDQFEHAGKQVQTIYDRLRDISAEIAVIHRRVERLEELVLLSQKVAVHCSVESVLGGDSYQFEGLRWITDALTIVNRGLRRMSRGLRV